MFLTGPGVVREAMGEDVTADELGGTRVHERNGVCHFVAPTDANAAYLARELLGYLPRHRDAAPPVHAGAAPARPTTPSDPVPADPRSVYDVRDVIRALVDGGELLEVSAGWARNLVTGFARIDGQHGRRGREPAALPGRDHRRRRVAEGRALRRPSATRSASRCSCSSTPPATCRAPRQESAGVIRFGAGFVHAFAAAEVPRVTLILRKAFGGAYITMNSKDLGADYVFAWPDAQIGVMAAKSAVGIINRRELAAADDPDADARRARRRSYAETQLVPAGGGARPATSTS